MGSCVTISSLTAVSSIANGGNLVQPRVVKSIIDSESGEKTDIETKVKSKTISKETSEKVLSMMESVVSEGTGKNAKVAGYRIGGKTGTSEDGVNTNKYVTSFLGVAPIENPQVVLLVTLYNPTGEGGHQGGGVAAPPPPLEPPPPFPPLFAIIIAIMMPTNRSFVPIGISLNAPIKAPILSSPYNLINFSSVSGLFRSISFFSVGLVYNVTV